MIQNLGGLKNHLPMYFNIWKVKKKLWGKLKLAVCFLNYYGSVIIPEVDRKTKLLMFWVGKRSEISKKNSESGWSFYKASRFIDVNKNWAPIIKLFYFSRENYKTLINWFGWTSVFSSFIYAPIKHFFHCFPFHFSAEFSSNVISWISQILPKFSF